VCNQYLVKGQQGQLVIKFVNDVHLCKILITDGEAVHISHGRIDPEQILQSLPGKTLEWVNFIAGYPVRKQLEMPLQERLLQAARGNQAPQAVPVVAVAPVVVQQTQQAEPAAVVAVKPSGPIVPAERVAAVVDGFIEQIGPLGTILADNISASLNYTSGEPMAQSIYSSFLSALAKEVPGEASKDFIRQFSLPTP
jgi:hypothetical protein